MTEAIENFLTNYRRERAYYVQAADECASQCEALLSREGIRAIVTSRAKRTASLKEKIIARNKTKNYQDSSQVRDDLVDLAGVRIALYFPSEKNRLSIVLASQFDIIDHRIFPKEASDESKTTDKIDRSTGGYQKIFSGYHANHFLVKIKSDNLPEDKKELSETSIEIQVASVLMHAWSEVEHDLVYKPHSGNLGNTELAILDELNGMVLSGEIALTRLLVASEDRVRDRDVRYDNQYELAAHLIKLYKEKFSDFDTRPLGNVQNLMKLLQKTDYDSPKKLTSIFQDLSKIDADQTITSMISSKFRKIDPVSHKIWQKEISKDKGRKAIPRKFTTRTWFSINMAQISNLMLAISKNPGGTAILEGNGFDFNELNELRKIRAELSQNSLYSADFDSLHKRAQKVLSKLKQVVIKINAQNATSATSSTEDT